MSGAVIFGIAVGFTLSLWMRRISHDDVLVFAITLSTCFLVAYFALFSGFNISMGLTTLVIGLYFSQHCKQFIYKSSTISLELIF
jgi:hypothetical protein